MNNIKELEHALALARKELDDKSANWKLPPEANIWEWKVEATGCVDVFDFVKERTAQAYNAFSNALTEYYYLFEKPHPYLRSEHSRKMVRGIVTKSNLLILPFHRWFIVKTNSHLEGCIYVQITDVEHTQFKSGIFPERLRNTEE